MLGRFAGEINGKLQCSAPADRSGPEQPRADTAQCSKEYEPPPEKAAQVVMLRFAAQLIVTATAAEGIPFATTTRVLAPVSIPAGTSNFVETAFVPVATPIVLWVCVLQ